MYVIVFHSASVSSPPDAYFYADTHGLVWDKQLNCWTKDDLGGGASLSSTSRLSPSPSPSPDHRSTPTLHSYSSTTSVDAEGSVSTLRMATPELSQYGGYPSATGGGGGGGGGGGYGRPLSQMSFSDDLQTIPSQEVLFVHVHVECMNVI